MSRPHASTGSVETTRVLVVEDQGMFRSFLEEWVPSQSDFVLVGAFTSAEEALRRIETLSPHVALLDLQLPGMDGIALAQALRQVRPHLRTLLLSSLSDPLTLTRIRESGVEGYLEKDAPLAELAEALRTVVRGRSYFSRKFTETLAQESAKSEALGKILSRREQQVLTQVLTGRTSKEIGESIGLSPRTVEFHRSNLMAKLGASNLAELLVHARQRGLA
ncbi:two component transcriptional regulator, LuxR family [Chthoniobacter flavus Ellin428]|uniref:Two component transcriptional regulator, LuxR family n=1 Tax=Chthoniobacter flavus Ellin428 TaxID=497964 RepID=B4D411_9BACT|nr:response regulator transcription factor [Chthoniobacter flavus]EDY18991.1 two component transcriptional regulator, LuxR family [Chthoniobacter flavus Ellin428]TCO93572.1 LuxR family two component transcriptional regulator [Chthoniobacter flavus]